MCFQIYDGDPSSGNGEKTATICGSYLQPTSLYRNQVVVLYFHSNENVTGTGFSAEYRQIVGMSMLIKIKLSSFKSNENIHKKEDGSCYVVSANKASSVTL